LRKTFAQPQKKEEEINKAKVQVLGSSTQAAVGEGGGGMGGENGQRGRTHRQRTPVRIQ